MATLTNTKIKDTYDGLLKTTDNDVLDVSGVTLIEDGLGNASALSLGRANNGVTITGALTASGLTYPTTDGTAGQAIVTDAAGNLSFATVTTDTPNLQEVTDVSPSSTTNTITAKEVIAKGGSGNGVRIWEGNNYVASNIGIGGINTLGSITTGGNNVAIGGNAGISITTGFQNVTVGSETLSGVTTGSRNMALGFNALNNINGNDNVGIGFASGEEYNDGVTTGNKTLGEQNIYIGANTLSGDADTDNEIVIGYGATGNGSNTATYGNSSITDHYFNGNVHIDGAAYIDAAIVDSNGDSGESGQILSSTVTGTEWIDAPSGTTPTLQQVTVAGATTDRTIVIERQASPTLDFEDSTATGTTSSYIRFKRSKSSPNYGAIAYNSIGDDMVFSTTTLSNTVLTLTGAGNAEVSNNLDVSGNLAVDTNTLYVDATNNKVGVNTSTFGTFDMARINGSNSVANDLTLRAPNTSQVRINFADPESDAAGEVGYNHSTNSMRFVTNGTEKVVIDSSGNVGIGTSSPYAKVDADGDIYIRGLNTDRYLRFIEPANDSYQGFYLNCDGANNDFYIGSHEIDNTNTLNDVNAIRIDRGSADVTFLGAISKGSGSFKIDHPLEEKKDTHYLVHSFVESPQANNIYRGKVQLVDGSASINLDEVSTMSEGTFVLLNRDIHTYTSNESDWDAVRGSVEGNILTIECQNLESTAIVSWLVIGERHDQHMYDTSWTDENGKVIVEPIKQIEE